MTTESPEVARRLLADKLEPLQPWLAREGTTDIWLYPDRLVYQDAKPQPTEVSVDFDGSVRPWLTAEWLRTVAGMLKTPAGEVANARRPMLSTMLDNGARVSVVVPPAIAPRAVASITIRVPQRIVRTHEELASRSGFNLYGLLPDPVSAAVYMHDAAQAGRGIIASGHTGSGKTTYLRALAALVDPLARIFMAENVPEISLPEHRNLLATLFDEEGETGVTAEQLVMLAMRESPYAFVMGEVRSRVVRELVSLVNSGMRSWFATTHAKSPAGVLRRFVSLWGSESDIAVGQIRDAIDIVAQLHYVPGVGRRITCISERGEVRWIAPGYSA